MVQRGKGLIVEVTDGIDYRYRGSLFYSLAKISPIHLAAAMAADLKPYGVTAVAVTPGFLRSEEKSTLAYRKPIGLMPCKAASPMPSISVNRKRRISLAGELPRLQQAANCCLTKAYPFTISPPLICSICPVI